MLMIALFVMVGFGLILVTRPDLVGKSVRRRNAGLRVRKLSFRIAGLVLILTAAYLFWAAFADFR
jgi:hypothetical protein